MTDISLKAPAKINLSLDVVSKKDNGYHNLSMVMQSISLYDIISIKRDVDFSESSKILADDLCNNIKITCNIKKIPTDKSNIVYKCAEAFFKYLDIKNQNISIDITKKIPSAAGLAGGSSDGAVILVGLNILFDNKLSYDELISIGAKIGADIPFCITGGTALCEGIGEIITPLFPLLSGYVLICKPDIDVSTKEIFSKVDINNLKNHPNTEKLIEACESNNLPLLCQNMYNCLEEITSPMFLEISSIEKEMESLGCIGTMMSGSGPTVFGIFENETVCKKAYTKLKKTFKQTYITTFCEGIEIIKKGK